MRVGMWTPEDAQRLKQGTLLQTPREEEALKKIPPLLKKGPKDHQNEGGGNINTLVSI